MQPPPIDPALGLALVTGASGFVGSRLVHRLRAAGRPVRALSRSDMPELAAAGAEVVRTDVTDADAIARACHGADTVYHVAAKVGIWGRAADFECTNIDGTRHVIDACRSAGVRRLVFTSSPSVVFNDADLAGADESLPLGTAFPADYPRTKAAAEALALAASDPGRLAVTALRPHLVWGVGDKNLLPRVVTRARAGRLRIVGPGTNKVDLTHIENVVDAHVLAEAALARPDSPAAGRAYFVTNGEPVLLWPWINDILARLGVRPVAKRLSLARARRIGAVCEALWRILPLGGEPPMTRFLAAELAKDHWFDISAARRDLGYQPRISMTTGVATLVPWLRQTLR
ncbi:NAD-dependent epimerase/dehydratase family protein [Opitutales bacterium ASA1]|uniref:NAD-dependent epimerase/dehydratase family protein n=1 Tax=Congregicoccus parvus TaxID=3081749 RepID=UPI002B2CBFC1|nr:NAD-dependent epimerase/dehydratase family protein [Opitutales bacterium ASA1]